MLANAKEGSDLSRCSFAVSHHLRIVRRLLRINNSWFARVAQAWIEFLGPARRLL